MHAFSRFSAAGCLTFLAASWTLGADAVRWEPDFETAMHKAAQQNRLVLVHFWNDGCPPCVVVDRQVFPSVQVADAVHASYVPVKVHAGQRADLARRYGVEQWPTDVFLAPTGQRVAAYISPKTAKDYSEMVSYIASREQGRMGASSPHVAQAPANQTAGAGDRNSTFPTGGASAPAGRGSYEVQAGGEFPLSNNRGMNGPSSQPGYTSPYLPGGNLAQQPFSPQGNAAPPLMNPFSQNASPYGGLGAQPGVNMARNPAVGPMNTPTGPAMNPASALPMQPQGGLGSPALNANAGWPPIAPSGTAPAVTIGNAPAQVNQPPLGAPQHSGLQQPQAQLPIQQPNIQQPTIQQPALQLPIGAMGQPASPPQQAQPAGPKFAMEGYCIVSLVEQLHLPVQQQQWRKGDPRWGAVHRGQTYLFASQAEQQKFLANPDYYTPFLSGYDPVVFAEQGTLIDGRREYGFNHDGRIYMFSSEQNLQKFWNSRDMFISRVQQAMNATANQRR